MDDSEILSLYRSRSPRAIEETRNKYGAYCFQVAKNILSSHEDAEECVSDTWLGAWNAIPPLIPGNLRLYLARLTRNLSFNCWKAQHARKRGGGELPLVLEELSECLASETDVEGEAIARELAQSVRNFTRSLPQRECSIFLRRYFYAEPVRDIAERFGLTPGNTSVILSRTREKLKKQLIAEGYFDESRRSV